MKDNKTLDEVYRSFQNLDEEKKQKFEIAYSTGNGKPEIHSKYPNTSKKNITIASNKTAELYDELRNGYGGNLQLKLSNI